MSVSKENLDPAVNRGKEREFDEEQAAAKRQSQEMSSVATVTLTGDAVTFQLTTDDHLFWISCKAEEMEAFIANPVAFAMHHVKRDFRAEGNKDVTVVFSFNDNKTVADNEYLIEGTFATNVLTVRAARPPAFIPPAPANAAQDLKLVLKKTKVHIARGPKKGDFYTHYQLDGDLAAARKRIAGFVLSPDLLVYEMNELAQTSIMGGRPHPVEKPV
ncbi:MAG: hypothetical protein V4671_01245, partial [Armatimonadota bacterium]